MSLKKMEQVNDLMNEFADMMELDITLAAHSKIAGMEVIISIIENYISEFEDLRLEILKAID